MIGDPPPDQPGMTREFVPCPSPAGCGTALRREDWTPVVCGCDHYCTRGGTLRVTGQCPLCGFTPSHSYFDALHPNERVQTYQAQALSEVLSVAADIARRCVVEDDEDPAVLDRKRVAWAQRLKQAVDQYRRPPQPSKPPPPPPPAGENPGKVTRWP